MTSLNKFFPEVRPPRVVEFGRVDNTLVNPELVIGFELEVEGCDAKTGSQWVSGAGSHQFNVDRDGSLRGTAYEFISRPMATKHAYPACADFLRWAEFTNANYSDRCSVHVHVNCTDMEMEQISNVALLYTVAEEILFGFVGQHRDSNIYCIPWSQCRAHLDLIQTFLTKPETSLKRWNKYTALNLIPLASLGTVEFRQMHGTADTEKLRQWVNMIGAIFKWAKEVPLKDLISEIKSLNTTSQYEVFFNRLVGGQLPYTDAYRSKMEAGVIFAKYSLISMSRNKKVPEKVAVDVPENVRPAAAPRPRAIGAGEIPAARAAAQYRVRPLAMTNGDVEAAPRFMPDAYEIRDTIVHGNLAEMWGIAQAATLPRNET